MYLLILLASFCYSASIALKPSLVHSARTETRLQIANFHANFHPAAQNKYPQIPSSNSALQSIKSRKPMRFSFKSRAPLKVSAIIGGTRVSPQKASELYPFYGLLGNGGDICGGVMISPDYLLTAAHCSKNPEILEDKSVSLYMHDLFQVPYQQNAIMMKVKHIKVYPGFNFTAIGGPMQDGDIAIWKVETWFNEKNKPLVYANLDTGIHLPESLTAIGFGRSSRTSNIPPTLQEADLTPISNDLMQKHFDKIGFKFKLSEKTFTTVLMQSGYRKHTAPGDSGGPLFSIDENGKATVFGIISGGIFSSDVAPGVSIFTRVSAFKDWIMASMEEMNKTLYE